MKRLSLLLMVLLSGCQSMPLSDTSAARISAHSQESLVELRQAVKSLMNGRDVLVAASAFTKSDRLIIQRQPIRGPGGRVIDTRVGESPVIFRLFLSEGNCYVRHEDSDTSIQLYRANCSSL